MSSSGDKFTLEFERPIRELEGQLQVASNQSEMKKIKEKILSLEKDIYPNLTSWERVLLSRHPKRPHAIDYIDNIITDFFELSGDRYFANDKSIIAGFGYLSKKKVAVIGIEKGNKTKEKILRNFGMPRPEGYRKALRIMKLADRFKIPIITLIDTPGAYPGIGAEERGQSLAIANNLSEMFQLQTPIISLVIGEGGSGGALGIGVADRVLMMEYSTYSVISPESCASILWADPQKANIAANSLQLGPQKAKELDVIDEIILEPIGGAHRNKEKSFIAVKNALSNNLTEMDGKCQKTLRELRFKKFRKMGNLTLVRK
ncbi:MAG: acetyl-CoA carboxylase carboxyltransferase subunit alpha [Bdellovibrionales bacterium]|nr:acetyl-CoA carboxylase carboxyltransferase subunit alpha [Bdellovibrionales bacterium]